ncbi:uncharacterized protein LOC143487636 [Brachyhypopomus gauderio]|uniref:uncharacterized protein LOC143487636 n=1 Tax=Brachyhypopomus gauderio TaxID=698409 RepID=UPI00404302A5
MAHFDLTEFSLFPTLEQFDKCRKADLLLIAEFFNVTVPRDASKRDIKQALEHSLVRDGILPDRGGVPSLLPLPGESVADDAGERVGSVHVDSVLGVSVTDPMLEIKLKELELEIKRQEREAELLRVRALQIEADKEIALKRLAMDAGRPVPLPRKTAPSAAGSPIPGSSPEPHMCSPRAQRDIPVPLPRSVSAPASFDVSRQISLVPAFREQEVDAYFSIFERIATTLQWPKELWSLMLQCKLTGKAQEACSSLSLTQSIDYDMVKAAVLRAYELVPEAYRQNFRGLVKNPNQTYTDFAREKTLLFEKWCTASNVTTFEQLKELILIEEFKNCLPENVVIYLNEQKACNVAVAATSADEFVLTHKTVFSPSSRSRCTPPNRGVKSVTVTSSSPLEAARDTRQCFYCHAPGHVIVACPVLKRKALRNPGAIKKVNAVSRVPSVVSSVPDVDPVFQPFIFEGCVSLSEMSEQKRPIKGLRDTGASVSLILKSVLPFSEESYCSTDVLIKGVELGVLRFPLHTMFLEAATFTGIVKVAVCSELPVSGVSFILGNDIAGGVVLVPEVVEQPITDVALDTPEYFPACVLTRAQAAKLGEVPLRDTFMSKLSELNKPVDALDSASPVEHPVTTPAGVTASHAQPTYSDTETSMSDLLSRADLIKAQNTDQTLIKCFERVDNGSFSPEYQNAYFIQDGVLLRSWVSPKEGHESITQVVVPRQYRSHILSLAHDHPLAGHLGIRKTTQRVLQHFFWPSVSSDVANYCRTCDACQMVGKPNQNIPPAPLCPIPAVGEPFERVLIDCVGPLPKTRAGNRYIFTLMCAATRYPEAIPLHSLRSKAIVKALIKFFSTFGLPICIQSDQGTNFTSRLFTQVTQELGIHHQFSSAYHPESQGALERFHQTFKNVTDLLLGI